MVRLVVEKDRMTPPIVGFVGRSNSGKTTLIERLLPELVLAGYRVATIKHAGHGFDLAKAVRDESQLSRGRHLGIELL